MSGVLARIATLLTKGSGPCESRICKAPGHGFAKRIQPKTAERFKTADTQSKLHIPIPALFLIFAISLATTAHAAPGTWSDFATVSMTDPQTQKLTANGICWSDGTDILCDGTAGLASGGGTVADKIISSTTKVTANTTGYVSFTTGGTTTGYMDTAGNFILPGVSTTGTVSASNGTITNNLFIGSNPIATTASLYVSSSNGVMALFERAAVVNSRWTLGLGNGTYMLANSMKFSGLGDFNIENNTTSLPSFLVRNSTGNVYVPNGSLGIGISTSAVPTIAPSASLHVSGTMMVTSGSLVTPAFYVSTTGYVGIGTANPSTTLHVNGTMSATGMNFTSNGVTSAFMGYLSSASSYFQFNAGGSNLYFRNSGGNNVAAINSGGWLGLGGNLTLSSTLTVSGTGLITSWTAINTNITPTAPLEVSGTISATRFVGDGSGLTGIVAAANGDNITSGTTKVTANTTGYVSFTTGGTTTGYMDTAGNFILAGVSATGNISATKLFTSSDASIGGNATVGSHVFLNDRNIVGWGNAGGTNIRGSNSTNTQSLTITIGGTEAMRIVSTGYVGIGTSTPTTTLHVSGTGLFNGTITSNAASGGQLVAQSTAGTGYLQMTTGSSLKLVNNTPGGPITLLVNSGSTEALRAINSGYIGIGGVATPTVPLEVSGTISATSLYTSGTVRVGGTGSETCSSPSDYGKNRYNPATGHMQVCVPR